jgi:hypothetical protein
LAKNPLQKALNTTRLCKHRQTCLTGSILFSRNLSRTLSPPARKVN